MSRNVGVMWAKLDDELLDHHKIFEAGELLGHDGPLLALGMYCLGLMYANRHLTDGHLPDVVVKRFSHATNPLAVADALARAGLWDRNGTGFEIHHFREYNPSARKIKEKRKEDRIRKEKARHGS